MRREGQTRLTVIPCELDEANYYVKENHRHNGPVTCHKFSLAVADEENQIRGVAIVGRPVARALCDSWTLEINRVCTDGHPNACSMLYAAAWRAARAMGYRRVVTYTLTTEPGTSLKAIGFRCIGEVGGGTWHRPNCGRPRIDKHPTQKKFRWELTEEAT